MNTSNASNSNAVWPVPQAAYVHVPFCRHRCGYCNFTLVAGRDDLIDAYLNALEREFNLLGRTYNVRTLYFGGGTPSHLAPAQLNRLFVLVRRWLEPDADCEITVEANPADIDTARLEAMAAAGVNRISLGVQSFNDAKLALLERDHRQADVVRCLELAAAWIPRRCVDLIFGCPGETLDTWHRDLDQAIGLQADHISTYGLTFEQGTQFWNRRRRGELASLEEDLERELYVAGIDRLSSSGFRHYEVSNFALAGCESQHNQVYWSGLPYLAFGPGAARYVDGTRLMNHRSTTTWIKRLERGESPVAEVETLADEDRARELLMLSMRRTAGVDLAAFYQRTGFHAAQLWGTFLPDALRHELIEQAPNRLRLTRAGLLVSDMLWTKLLRR